MINLQSSANVLKRCDRRRQDHEKRAQIDGTIRKIDIFLNKITFS